MCENAIDCTPICHISSLSVDVKLETFDIDCLLLLFGLSVKERLHGKVGRRFDLHIDFQAFRPSPPSFSSISSASSMSIDSTLHNLLRTHLGSLGTFTARGGGRIEASSGSSLFAKISTPSNAAQVRGEIASLRALESAATANGGASLTPAIKAAGEEDGRCWLATDYLDMSGSKGDQKTQRELGRRLAEMHKAGTAEQFGFDVPTHCGVTVSGYCISL